MRVITTLADQTTSILKDVDGIGGLLGLVVDILSYGLGVAAVVGVVIAGIMYLTARDNESQVANAKQRLLNTVIGLVAWVVLFSVLHWLIPGAMPDPSNPEQNITPTEHPSASNNSSSNGSGSSGSNSNSGSTDNQKDWADMTCSEKRKSLKEAGMSSGEVNAMLRDEGC